MKKNNSIRIACLSLILFLLCPMIAYAETKTADIITITSQKDLLVMFIFETEIVDIVFIAPDGTRYTSDHESVECACGNLWMTYRIKDAMPGTWAVEYDLKSNTAIEYSIIDETTGIWIQYINILEQSEESVAIEFLAEGGSEGQKYQYVLSVIDVHTNELVEIETGTADSGAVIQCFIPMAQFGTGEYCVQLYVYYSDGER